MRTPILLPITALLLAACAGNPLPPPTADQPTDTSMINTAYWTAQPYCAGRVQMRLPAERRYGSRDQGQTENYHYNGWHIKHYADDWRFLNVILTQRRQGGFNRYFDRRTGHGEGYIGERELIPGRAFLQFTRKTPMFDGSRLSSNLGIRYDAELIVKLGPNGGFHTDGELKIPTPGGTEPHNWRQQELPLLDKATQEMRRELTSRLRERQPYEVPRRKGGCIPDGFFADNGDTPFKASTSVYFTGQDDTYIFIVQGRNPRSASIANSRNHPDTEGFKGFMQSLTAHAVRQGPRTINGMPGYEKISRWDGNHYLLRWERESDHLLVMMPFGTETFDGTKRSQQEILAIWDTVLATLKPVE